MIRIAPVVLILSGCASSGVPVLGDGAHSLERVHVDVVATAEDGLAFPTDLAFSPDSPGDLWVLNKDANSTTIVFDADSDEPWSEHYYSMGSDHFLASPVALAFADSGYFATAHDTDEKTQGPNGTPGDFMGPTLWPSDHEAYDAGHGSHLDMLHNTPLGKGIAWETGNAYWLFDGYHSSLTRYDFAEDHGPGGADHSDGIIARYAEGEVAPHETSVSHLLMIDGMLYVADTGNRRIAVLDPTSGERGDNISPNYDGADQYRVDGATIRTFIGADAFDKVKFGLRAPAGLAFDGDVLYVSDHETSRILAFDLEGELLDWLVLDVPDGSLGGITLDDQGRLYAVDSVNDQVLRITGVE